MKTILTIFCFLFFLHISAQENYVSKVWIADNGDGTYKNPILNADYSDPDAIRVGNDYYLTASSFEDIPGLPVLHSKDLVNWKLIGHALKKLTPVQHFSKPRHGEGVWAPAIRFRNGEFYIYYPDPDFGIFLVKAKNAAGPWSEPILVQEGKGLIDPCPLWDDYGKTYLVHAFAGSRAGIKSIIVIKEMNTEGTKVLNDGVLVYDGHESDPTIEGPKIYKQNGWYYIFAPAGGVSTGWQLVLRSKNIYGPYERKVVMDQGTTSVNGPHQGAWIRTAQGADWFIHFQDKNAYGRVVHLQPMKWVNDWPVIGIDNDGDGKGEPVVIFKKPENISSRQKTTPVESDEFNGKMLGLQWQWMSNPKSTWYFLHSSKGALRLYAQRTDTLKNLWFAGSVLQQKPVAEEFMITTKMEFRPNPSLENEKAGLAVMGLSYAGIVLESSKQGLKLVYIETTDAADGNKEIKTVISSISQNNIYLRMIVKAGFVCRFSYSLDGKIFTDTGKQFTASAGRWKGAKHGIFCTRESDTNDAGYADFDWFRVEAIVN